MSDNERRDKDDIKIALTEYNSLTHCIEKVYFMKSLGQKLYGMHKHLVISYKRVYIWQAYGTHILMADMLYTQEMEHLILYTTL